LQRLPAAGVAPTPGRNLIGPKGYGCGLLHWVEVWAGEHLGRRCRAFSLLRDWFRVHPPVWPIGPLSHHLPVTVDTFEADNSRPHAHRRGPAECAAKQDENQQIHRKGRKGSEERLLALPAEFSAACGSRQIFSQLG